MDRHILVVDDDTLLAEMFSRYLTASGYAVTTAESGEEALSLLKSSRFDLVLSDIYMQGKDGFTVLAACKTWHPETKVILCSGDCAYQTVSAAFNNGADGFLAKPFPAGQLREQILFCLGPARQDGSAPVAGPDTAAGRQAWPDPVSRGRLCPDRT